MFLNPKAKTERAIPKINTLKIVREQKRKCFSLLNIYSTSECRVSYKNCLYCNRRTDFQMISFNKLSAIISHKNAIKQDKIVEKRSTLEQRSSVIGFTSLIFSNYVTEYATIEHILEHRFIFDDENRNNSLDLGKTIGDCIKSLITSKAEEIDSHEVTAVENFGKTRLENGSSLSLNITHKIVIVAFGMILSLWVIYLLFRKFTSSLAIK